MFHKLSLSTDYQLIYIDIYRTKNVDDFVNEMANAMLRINKKVWYKRVLEFLKNFRPILSINPISGQLEAEIKVSTENEGSKNIDLILMDIKMPGMNGYDAAEKIKFSYPNIPIVAQTAYSTESDKEMALSRGCNDFISKPLNRDVFMALIRKYLNPINS